MSVSGNRCENQVQSDITKEDCCRSAIGKGWGSPCEPCPKPEEDPNSLTEPTPGVGVGPDGGPPIGPGDYMHCVFLTCSSSHMNVTFSLDVQPELGT